MDSRSDPGRGMPAGAKPPPDASVGARAPTRSLLLVAAIACLLLAGLYVLRPFAPPRETGPDAADLPDEQQPQDQAAPPGRSGSSLSEPTSPIPAKVAAVREEALAVARRLVERFPGNPRALNVMAWMHQRFREPEQAMRYWQQCAEMSPDGGGDYYVSMGCAAIEAEQYEEALAMFRQAQARGANPFDVQTGLAEALINLGQIEQAIAAIEPNLTDDPRALPCYVLLAQAYLQLGEYENAKKNFEYVIQKAPTYSHAYYGLVRACGRLGEKEKCAEYLDKFNRLKTAETVERRTKLGILRHEDEAIQELAAVLRLAAGVYEDQGDVREAESHLVRAAAVNRADTNSREALVRLYRRQNRLPEALAQIEQLCKIEPENPDYARGAATLSDRLRRSDSADQTPEQIPQQSPEESGPRESAVPGHRADGPGEAAR